MKKDKTIVVKKGKVVTKKKTYKIPKKIRKKFMEGLIRYTNLTNLQNGDYQKKSNALLSKDPLTVDIAFKYVDSSINDSNGNNCPAVMIYPNHASGEVLSYEKETQDSQVNHDATIECEFKRIENHYREFSKMPIGSIFVLMGFIMVKTGGSSKAVIVDIVSNDVIDKLTNDKKSKYLDFIISYNNFKMIPEDIRITKGDTVSVMRNKLNRQMKYMINFIGVDSDHWYITYISMILIALNFYINGSDVDDELHKYDKSGGLILFKDLYVLDINDLLLGKTDDYKVSPHIFEIIAFNSVDCYAEALPLRNTSKEPEVESCDDDDEDDDDDETDSD